MLKEEDRIFKNLYNNLGWEINHAIEREDWELVEEAISVIKGEDEFVEMLDFDDEDENDIY